MTEEKRKRGRPPGSGKKKPEIRYIEPVAPQVAAALYNAEHPDQHIEVVEMTLAEFREKFPQLPESEIIEMSERAKNYVPSRLEAIADVMEDVFLAKNKIDQLKQKRPVADRPYPSNWAELGKVAKLQWLTEQNAKK